MRRPAEFARSTSRITPVKGATASPTDEEQPLTIEVLSIEVPDFSGKQGRGRRVAAGTGRPLVQSDKASHEYGTGGRRNGTGRRGQQPWVARSAPQRIRRSGSFAPVRRSGCGSPASDAARCAGGENFCGACGANLVATVQQHLDRFAADFAKLSRWRREGRFDDAIALLEKLAQVAIRN